MSDASKKTAVNNNRSRENKRPAQGKRVSNTPHQTVVLRNEWYRDSFKKIVSITSFSIILNLVFAAGYVYRYVNPVEPVYFATTSSGQLIPIVPLSTPNMSSAAIVQFAADAVRESYSFDFSNYKSQLNKAGSEYFTPDGFNKFLKALVDSGNLEAVKSKRLIVKTIVTGVPAITNQGPFNGVYSWRIEVPVSVHYQGSDAINKEDHIMTLTIQRRNVLDSSKGVGIIQFVVI